MARARRGKIHAMGFKGGICGARVPWSACTTEAGEITCKKCKEIRRDAIERWKSDRAAHAEDRR